MKSVLLGVILLISNILWAQQGVSSQEKRDNKYMIELKDYSYKSKGDDGICFTEVNFYSISDSNSEHFFSSNYNEEYFTRIFLIKNNIKNIRYNAFSKDKKRKWLNWVCDGAEAHINKNLPVQTFGNYIFEQGYGRNRDKEAENWMDFKYKIIPLHTLKRDIKGGVEETFLPTNNKVKLFAKTGFPAELYHYQYSLDNSTWVDIPSSLYNKETLTLSAKDLFGNQVANYLGKKVWFRVVACPDGSGNYQSWSDSVFLTVAESSPHISTHTVSPVTCSDSEDGKIRLNFDRTLKTGETLEFALTNTDTGVIVNNYDATAVLRAGTSYSIESLAPGKYKLNLRGIYNGNLTYTDGSQHSVEFEVKKPDPVGFSLTSQTNVFCFGGNDGAFRIDGTGGQNSYQYSLDNGATWVNFSHTQHTIITGLSAGTYNVKVRDTNHCIAKNNRGNDKVITVNITEPTKAIAFSDIENVQPKGHGLSNGYISIKVTGGTPFADGSYHYQWRKDSPTGAVIPSSQITTDKTTHPFTIVLKNIPAGKYYLTVKDKNHAGATSNLQSCGIISREFIVTQPDPLIANIMQEQGISCHKDNNDAFKMDVNGNGINDNAEDGSIKAQVKGGVGGYQYQWQKEAGGVFTNISGATRNILENLTAGKYKLIIKDRNDNTTSAVFQLNFPSQLKINLSSTTLKCNGLEDGKVTVSATGGTGGYTYLWNTLDTSPIVEGLGAGNYFVTVTDSKSCSVKGSIEIEQPSQLEITDVDIKNPVCHGATNGKISVRASGGRAPYSLVWSNGMEGETISGLRAGKYVLTFTDANGCHMTKEYILTNPEKFTVDLGGDITLCVGDSKEYDITVSDRAATYQWKDANGRVISINPKIRISQAGTYTAIITNTKGCIATDQITVRNSTEELHPHMMLPTQAYVERTVKLVNTSNPRPQRVEWIIPRTSKVQVIEQNDDYLEVKFHSTGSYNFGLKGHQGACEKIFYKTVVVEENLSGVDIDPTRTSNIKEFTIVPNPNNGDYKVIVKLYEESDIKLRIIDMLSEEPFAPILKNRSVNYEIHFNQPTLPTGTYLIILETKGESQVKKMIVN